jgi:putative redox protein
MDAWARWKQGLSFTGSADSGFEVPLGADQAVGGANDGFRPMELMAISLAGCTAMDVVSILRKKQQQVTDFEVTVHTEKAREQPHVFTSAVVTYRVTGRGIDEQAVRRAIELSATKYCSAQAMLRQIVPMDLLYEISEEGNKKEPVIRGQYRLPRPG